VRALGRQVRAIDPDGAPLGSPFPENNPAVLIANNDKQIALSESELFPRCAPENNLAVGKDCSSHGGVIWFKGPPKAIPFAAGAPGCPGRQVGRISSKQSPAACRIGLDRPLEGIVRRHSFASHSFGANWLGAAA
jgi:hypothetical protein